MICTIWLIRSAAKWPQNISRLLTYTPYSCFLRPHSYFRNFLPLRLESGFRFQVLFACFNLPVGSTAFERCALVFPRGITWRLRDIVFRVINSSKRDQLGRQEQKSSGPDGKRSFKPSSKSWSRMPFWRVSIRLQAFFCLTAGVLRFFPHKSAGSLSFKLRWNRSSCHTIGLLR